MGSAQGPSGSSGSKCSESAACFVTLVVIAPLCRAVLADSTMKLVNYPMRSAHGAFWT